MSSSVVATMIGHAGPFVVLFYFHKQRFLEVEQVFQFNFHIKIHFESYDLLLRLKKNNRNKLYKRWMVIDNIVKKRCSFGFLICHSYMILVQRFDFQLCRRELLALIRTTFNSGFKCLTVGPAGHADLFPIKTDSFDAISLE